MRDIKLTLSTDPRLRAPSIQDEAQRMKREGNLWYPLHVRPKYAGAGCWVYFIRDGELVARARAEEIKECHEETLYSYTGKPMELDGWHVRCNNVELATKPISHLGFQGFRYVTSDDQKLFENAFE
jgi:hypothetical protein